ncbi:MAG: polysaccharide deacetylase family protein [Betaproteobacteria bacterium]
MGGAVSPAWQGFEDELRRWADAGRSVEFWWRDDDAARPDPALFRLLALAERARAPLALAVVPAGAQAPIFAGMGPMTSVIQHGTDHRNRAAPGAKKSEFPEGAAAAEAIARLASARARLAGLAGSRMVPALAPPWNRIDRSLVPALAGAGLRGLSQYGPRSAAEPAPGLRQVNTHVDIIDWRGSRGFAGEAVVLRMAESHLAARRGGRVDPEEPTGWLTHHACHDEIAWTFLERLFEFTARRGVIHWRSAAELFH